MGWKETEVREAIATSVTASDDALTAELADGRTITVPIAWFPRLAHGTSAQRSNWRLIGGGVGIHWPDLDEDISIESLLRAFI
jgi:predicted metalloprotease